MSKINFYVANLSGSSEDYHYKAMHEFLTSSHIRPVPAIKAIPDYYKDTPSFVQGHRKTIKRCVPVLDAFSLGYIIRSHMNVKFKWDKNKKSWACLYSDDGNFFQKFEAHEDIQITNLIKRKKLRYPGALKYINPWCIETDPGYSCLCIQPLNGGVNEIEFIAGSVDTDKYNNPVNFPFLFKNGYDEFEIKVGDPLVQVIPYKRESVNLNIGPTTEAISVKVKKQQLLLKSQFNDVYRNFFWHKNQKPKEPWYNRLFKK